MANILLTNICNQKCSYCFAVNQLEREKAEMSFKDLKFVLSFLKRSRENTIRLMGGEPTLHSQFSKVINYILSQDLKVHIFTNGLFNIGIANFLKSKGKDIKYSFNINPKNMYSEKNWRLINANLKLVTPFKNSLIGSVIFKEEFKIDYLIDLVNRYSVKAVILRIGNPIIKKQNEFLYFKKHQTLAKNIIREIKKTDKNKIKIVFGCGFSKNMFSKNQLEFLKNHQVINLGWGCDGNSGRFDIATDLSIFRCFPLSEWKSKKLSSFQSSYEIEKYFNRFMHRYQKDNSIHDFIHQGPCFSYLLSKKNA